MVVRCCLLFAFSLVCTASFGQSAFPDTLNAWLGTALQLYDSGDYANSAKLARKCISAAEKEHITDVTGRAYCLLARGSFQLQDYNTGMQYARTALLETRKEGKIDRLADVYNINAILFLATNQLDSAYVYAEQAVRYYEQTGNVKGAAIAYTKLGHVFNIRGEYAKATPYYLRSYEMTRSDTLSQAFMTANLCLASNYIYLKQPDVALPHTLKSYQIARANHLFYEQSTSLYYLSGIYELKGDYRSALEYQRQYVEVRDSVMKNERIRQVKELEVKYEAAEKESAIQLLEKGRSRQKAVIWAALATLAVLLLVAGRIYRSYQQRTSDNQKLTAANTTLEAEKIKTERQLEEEARERERLNEMDAFKSRFFTNITHEFRTPLTIVLGVAEQLATRSSQWVVDRHQPDFSSKLTLIKRNGENLLLLINQILDLAKLENNSLTMNYVNGDVLAYLRYVAESMHSLANAHNILLRVESKEAQIVMDYDPDHLLQVVHNLLSNAIKFTPSGGRVVVTATSEGFKTLPTLTLPTLKITVADSGAGIPANELPFVFDRFFQAQNQAYAKAGGAGIGLSLTRELVRAMRGEISAESIEGQGAVFTVKLPITQTAQPAADRKFSVQTTTEALSPSQSNTNGRPPLPTGEMPNLLIVEDNPDVVEYLRSCLTEHYALDFAYNGRAGIEKALESVPDLIISDVMMPEKDGFEVCDSLKNDERTSHIPIILLTARADVESRLTGLRRGADAYLAKPFVEEELLVVTGNLLETRRKLQERYVTAALAAESPGANSAVEVAHNNPAAKAASTLDLEDAFLQKTIAHLEAHIDDAQFGNAELARKMLLSESQLHRKIKALTDQSLSVFIRSVRLRRGRILLETTDLSVSEVAYAVGFTDPAYFSRTFSAEFGAAPTALRR